MARIKVDLHDVFNSSGGIESALRQAFEDAADTRIKEIEIIPGKGSGQLKRKVERFLQRPEIKAQIHYVKTDFKNHGRMFVYLS